MAIFDHQDINQFFSERLYGQSYWLGAKKGRQNVATWVNGQEIEYEESWVSNLSILYVGASSKKCLRIGKVGQWRFERCEEKKRILCEFVSKIRFTVLE